jgi:hypothetical protein
MDAKSKNLSRNKLNAKNFEPNSETKFGQKGRTFHFERGNYVQSGLG